MKNKYDLKRYTDLERKPVSRKKVLTTVYTTQHIDGKAIWKVGVPLKCLNKFAKQ